MTDTEFEKALHKGLGRCVVELASLENIEAHKNTVLDCCTKNISSYIPFEKSRGEFLYQLVKKFNDDKYFLRPVVAAYMKEMPDCEDTYKKLIQMTDFLWFFEKENDIAVYEVLSNKYSAVKEALCARKDNLFFKDFFEFMSLKYIESEGFEGYIRVIRAIDTVCKRNEEFVLDDFCAVLDVGKNTFRAKKILQEAYLYTSRKMYNYFYISFKKANRTIPKYIAKEEKTEISFDVDKICLETARLMQQGEKVKEEKVFRLCKKIIELHETKQKKRLPKELLFFVYENSPSSYLRMRAIHFMGKKRMMTREIAAEAVNDCEEKTRKYIKQYHGQLLL